MSSIDEALLARLNKLRKSTVKFSSSTPRDGKPVVLDKETGDSDLANRFLNLRNGANYCNKEDLAVHPALEDLKNDFHDENISSLSLSDVKDIRTLAQEVGSFKHGGLGKNEKTTKEIEASAKVLASIATREVAREQDFPRSTNELPIGAASSSAQMEDGAKGFKRQENRDDKEADDYIARVIDELNVDDSPGSVTSKGSEQEQSQTRVKGTEDRSYEYDNESIISSEALSTGSKGSDTGDSIELNTSAPTISLPDVPTFAPVPKPSRQINAKSKVPMYDDEDIDSWCVICNDDATVKCLGCDGDLYCTGCWHEGHLTRDASYEERGHKKIKYQRSA